MHGLSRFILVGCSSPFLLLCILILMDVLAGWLAVLLPTIGKLGIRPPRRCDSRRQSQSPSTSHPLVSTCPPSFTREAVLGRKGRPRRGRGFMLRRPASHRLQMGIRGREMNIWSTRTHLGTSFEGCLMYFRERVGREVVVWMEEGLGRLDGISLSTLRGRPDDPEFVLDAWATCSVDRDDDCARNRRLYRSPCPIQGLLPLYPYLLCFPRCRIDATGAWTAHNKGMSDMIRYPRFVSHNPPCCEGCVPCARPLWLIAMMTR